MTDMDFIFSQEQYSKLNNEYSKLLIPNPDINTSILHHLIKTLENHGFNLPISLQNKVLNLLLGAQEVLSITIKDFSPIKSNSTISNPFELIRELTALSIQLNSCQLKSAYQILYAKTNNLILQATKEVSNYFSRKKFKIFKFM